jgi:hypothetical protein
MIRAFWAEHFNAGVAVQLNYLSANFVPSRLFKSGFQVQI